MGCIYLIKCLKNNKVYIGQYKLNEASKRFNRHISDAIKGSKYAIHQAIRKYGKDNFTIETLCICNTNEELDDKEKEYIKIYNSLIDSKGGNGYNMVDGGRYTTPVRPHTDEHKKYMSEIMKGRTHTTETKQKISEKIKLQWQKNKINNIVKTIITDKRNKKISESLKGKKWSENRRNNKINKRKEMTEEEKKEFSKKISEAKKGVKFSEESKNNMSIAQKEKFKNNPNANNSRKLKDEDVLYIRKNPDSLIQKEFAKKFNISIESIKNIIHYKTYKEILIDK